MPRQWWLPEGLRVLPDGSWQVAEMPVQHGRTLRHLKAHLVFEDAGTFVVDGARRLPVEVQGPAYEVLTLVLDAGRGEARAVLDDGSQEAIADASLGMSPDTGRFELSVKDGRARAVLSRTAHQLLLQHVEEDAGRFVLCVGPRRYTIRT